MYNDWNGQLGLPELVEIEPTETCNLRCKMCHVSYMPKMARPALDHQLFKKLSSIRGKHVIIGSGFEPTMNRGFASLVRSLTDLECKIELISNGVLIKDDVKAALVDSELFKMTFSFDGIRKQTYESIRRGANFEEVVENIVGFRALFAKRETYFSINSTVMRSNLAETMDASAFWDEHEFDGLNFINMVIRDLNAGLIMESIYPIRADYCSIMDDVAEHIIDEERRIVVSSAHYAESPLRKRYPNNFVGAQVISGHSRARLPPRVRQHFQLGEYPGMSFPCKSPFTFARILANGDVQLCYQFTVGNLNEGDLKDIWYGERAHAVREKVMRDVSICNYCDYYRFCLKSADVEIDNLSNYFTRELLPFAHAVNFETGGVSGGKWKGAPRLVNSLGEVNIVHFDTQFFVVPQALGDVDLTCLDLSEKISGPIRIASTLREASRLAAALQSPIAQQIATDTLKKIM